MNSINLGKVHKQLMLAGAALLMNCQFVWAGSQTFSAVGSVNWTAPANVFSVQVQAWGAGGAGGGGTSSASKDNRSEGGGGGGGAYASNTIPIVPGNTYSVVVGAGAVSTGNTYTTAGNSSFAGTSVVAAGGGNGQGFITGSTQSGTGGTGGQASASVGAVKFSGGAGENGITGVAASNAGGGGGSSAGVSANGNTSTSSTGVGAAAPTGGGNGGGGFGGNNGAGFGTNGAAPGGGGGGANIATSSQNGGSGGSGQVILNWTALPGVTSPTKTSITSTSATLGATVSSAGDAPVTDYGIVWATTQNPTIANHKVQVGTSVTPPNTYTKSITGLPAGTLIYYGGYATNSGGANYSAYDSFYTLSTPPSSQAAGLNAAPASSTVINLTWSTGSGASGYLIVQVASGTAPNGVPASGTAYTAGAAIGTDGGTVAAVVTPGTATGTTISGLTPGTTYSFAIYAFNWDGSDAGTYNYLTTSVSTASAATFVAPAISVIPGSLNFPPTLVGSASSALSYTIAGSNLTGNITIGAPANFQVSLTSGSGFGSSLTLTQSGGAVASTTIYVQFNPTAQTTYSANITHTSVGANNPNVGVSGTGAQVPSVATSAASGATTGGATLNGSVTSSNGATITDRGFYYQTTPGVTNTGTLADAGGTTLGAYSKAVTGLNPNQIYYYRAYAVNAVGTGLDASDTSFYTLANTPTAPTISAPTQTSVNVAIGSGDGNPSSTTYAIEETTTSKFVQANGALGALAVFQTAATWGSQIVTGLSKNSPYGFQVEAQNSVGATTAFGPLTPANTAASPFTPGNLAVLSPNNGTASATTFSVLEISPSVLNQSTPVQTININGTNGNPGTALQMGTSATSGGMSTSSDGTLLCFAGYNTTNGTGANTVLRGVGTLNGAGVFNLPATYSGDGALGNQSRSATTVDNHLFYWADKGGVYTNGDTSPSDAQNILRVRSFGGTVYEINQQGFASVVSTVSPDGTTLYPLPGFPTAKDGNAQDFYLISSGENGPVYDILYQLDNSSATAGTIFKYSLVNGQWQANSSYTTTLGGCSIAAAKTATGAVLYVVTAAGSADNNKLEELTDANGYNLTIALTDNGTLYTAPGSSSLKSVAFVPASCSVTYAGNNPTSGTVPTDNTAYGVGAPVTVSGNTGNLALTGYTFAGWNTAANGSGTSYSGGMNFTITSNTTLYAQWALIDTPITNSAECSSNPSYTWTPTGTPPYSYQWYHGSALLAGQTGATLTLSDVHSADSGNYYVVFSNSTTLTTNLVADLTVDDTHPPVLSVPANLTAMTGSGGVAVTFNPTATDACAGSVPVVCTPPSGSFFAPGLTLVTCLANDGSGNTSVGSFTVTVIDTNATTNILDSGTIYYPYSTNLPAGTWVWIDTTPSNSLMRCTQRPLGEREVDEKALAFAGFAFSQVTPTTNGAAVTYDYSNQNGKHTDTVGQLADKWDPIIIGPDGLAYITDGHHTVAAYLQTNSPVHDLIPGIHRIVLAQIEENLTGGAPVDDNWWLARQSENNAYLYGTNGDQLLLPGDPNYATSQPILPFADNSPMPLSPSEFSVDGVPAMTNDAYRSVGWGIRQGIVPTAFDRFGNQLTGYANTAPDGNSINFVDFYWSDFLRNRLVWNNALTPTGNGDTNAINAPLSFFAASANGIALAKSEFYRDQNGRSIFDYTNSATFTNTNTVYWAVTAIGNGLATPGDTYNLYLRDDSTINGDIIPSALSTNLLHIDTSAGMTLTQLVSNMYALYVNGGAVMTTVFPDSDVPNSTLTFPAGTGEVWLNDTAYISAASVVSNGICSVNGVLNCPVVTMAGGSTLAGTGTINGAVTVQNSASLAPGNSSIGTLTVKGSLTLAGTTAMDINKTGATLTSDLVTGVSTLTFGGTLTVIASGDALAAGDSFTLFSASHFMGTFAATNLPALAAGLHWDLSQLAQNGSIRVLGANTVYYSRAANVSLKIYISDLLSNVAVSNGFTASFVGVGTDGLNNLSTNGVTLLNLGAFIGYTQSVTPNVNDSFEYTVNDGHGTTYTGMVVITMNNNLTGQASPNLVFGNASVTASFFGVPGYRYAVDRSTNLTPGVGMGWVPISTNTAPAGGAFQVTDTFQNLGIPVPPLPPAVFYRLRYNP
jgi:uncharacterized repeat protein (TIGR02543 family)